MFWIGLILCYLVLGFTTGLIFQINHDQEGWLDDDWRATPIPYCIKPTIATCLMGQLEVFVTFLRTGRSGLHPY